MFSFPYSPTFTSIHDYWKNLSLNWWNFAGKVTSLLFNMLSRLVITFLPRSKRLLISWLQSPSAVILESPKIKSATVPPSSAMKWWDWMPWSIFPYTLAGFTGINLKVVDKESETSYYGNDNKIGGKASVSLGMGWIGKSLHLGLFFNSFLFPTKYLVLFRCLISICSLTFAYCLDKRDITGNIQT